MRASQFLKSIVAILLVASLATVFFACQRASTVQVSEMSAEELNECIELCNYKGVELSLNGRSKEQALISYIVANSSVKKYPVGTVDYYLLQLQKQYRYYADQAGMSYEAMLDELGEDNITMKAEARQLVKQDMIFELIRKREGITLTDAEKSKFFDKYVTRYAEKYGYAEDYVRKELTELVYESMLYDKTIEFLILNNSFNNGEADSVTDGTDVGTEVST